MGHVLSGGVFVPGLMAAEIFGSNCRFPPQKPDAASVSFSMNQNRSVATSMKLEENLVRLRKEHGLSQNDLAEKLNVSRQAVSRWEQGAAMPSTDNLIYLSKLYGITLDALIYGEEKTELELDQEPETASAPAAVPKRPTVIWNVKRLLFLILCVVLVGIGLYAAWNTVHDPSVTPIKNLERDKIDLSSMESASGTW